MYNQKTIATIKKLLEENTDASLTYAALECRLALEFICYARLKISHDYISHADLRAWQPKQIIDALIKEVDPRAGSTFTLSISQEPLESGAADLAAEEFATMNWVKLGTQIGFDPKKLGKLWNKLANAALHVAIPKNSSDEISRYGDPNRIRDAVVEALIEIERIDEGTINSGGYGSTISFECSCRTINQRRQALLNDRKIISCINPTCYESYSYISQTDEFQRRTFPIVCKSCTREHLIPVRYMEKELKIGSSLRVPCACGDAIYVEWRLMQAQNSSRKQI